MTGSTVAVLFLGLLVGLVVGALVGVLLARSRAQATGALADGELARTRAEVDRFRAEAERFRADAADARAETAGVRVGAAEDAARVSDVRAELAAAVAERDLAVARAAEIAADRESMVTQFKVLSGETAERQGKAVDAVASQRLEATERLLAPVRESLEQFRVRLSEVEKERVQMTADLSGHVRSVRDTGEALRRETQQLVTALRKPQVRGSWGETQLKRVAELAGMVDRCDFELQASVTTDGVTVRPDMRVHLGEGKHVHVDAKVPLSAFLDAAETDDETVRAGHLQRYAKHVRTHIDQLSSKQYWKSAESPEFVVLFLPTEAFFGAALDQMPDLYEYAVKRDIVLATPTTLIGMLRAVAYGWKQAALAETAAEVFALGRELHERLTTMGGKVDKLGRQLRSSVAAYNDTVASLEGRVLVTARRFRDLKVTENALGPVTPVEDSIRQIQAPELVEDAARVRPLVGRARTSRRGDRALPESDALFRTGPDVAELVDDVADGRSAEPDEGHTDARAEAGGA